MNVKYPLLQSDEEKQTTQRVIEKKNVAQSCRNITEI